MGERLIRTVDIETTGLPEDELHAICEIGWIDVELREEFPALNPKTFFVNPGHPIPSHVRAISHISDRDVAAAMPPTQALTILMKDMGPDDVLCAHKASFEQAFIPIDRKWVDTWKCALRAWPSWKSHSNQAGRYELGLDDEPGFDTALAMPPHRALPDAYVTAHILRRLLKLRPVERLIEISSEPAFLQTLNFGKHYGKTFKEVAETDRSYLRWVVEDSDRDEDTKFTARWHMDRVPA